MAEANRLGALVAELQAENARLSNVISDEQKDAARWRKFCGLMAYGNFTVMDCSTETARDIDYIHQLVAAVDAGSDRVADVGRKDDARCVGLPPR